MEIVEQPSAWISELASRLQSYAAGNEERFDDVPLDLSHLSAFQTRVVRACRRISRGLVRTYAELATTAGSPGAARAVGNCMAMNRFPIIVPCHRVVGSAGSLGGFSARDGINMKRRMEEIISHHTEQPLEKVSKDMERDYFMTAQEANDYGIIDTVITHR